MYRPCSLTAARRSAESLSLRPRREGFPGPTGAAAWWVDLREAKARMALVRYGLRRCPIAEEMGGQIPPRGAGDLRYPLATPPDHWLYAEKPDRD